ncbi:hypothetical protein AAFF_G00430890 [Aldrovandia affinis]|uniref:Uncharacterized protein n=1 Tax=Aldrovandia affinis TaxID=143900 RepID=A0AAD7VYF4_9TELE|nr:hypothetical protein AAFF_G00430890 [Aldrovandia affinis]
MFRACPDRKHSYAELFRVGEGQEVVPSLGPPREVLPSGGTVVAAPAPAGAKEKDPKATPGSAPGPRRAAADDPDPDPGQIAVEETASRPAPGLAPVPALALAPAPAPAPVPVPPSSSQNPNTPPPVSAALSPAKVSGTREGQALSGPPVPPAPGPSSADGDGAVEVVAQAAMSLEPIDSEPGEAWGDSPGPEGEEGYATPPEHAGTRRKRGSSPGEGRPRRRRKPQSRFETTNKYGVLSSESGMDSETETETETLSPRTPVEHFFSTMLGFESKLGDQAEAMDSEIPPTPSGLVGEGN